MIINKEQLAKRYAASLEGKEKISITEAGKRINDICKLIVKELQAGNTVRLSKYFTFQVKERKAFIGTHPQTGEPLSYEATKVIRITPAKSLKRIFKEKR